MEISLDVKLSNTFLTQRVIDAIILIDGKDDEIEDVDFEDALVVLHLLCDVIVDYYVLDDDGQAILDQVRSYCSRKQRRG